MNGVTKSRMSEIFAQPVANETKAMAIVPAKIPRSAYAMVARTLAASTTGRLLTR